MQVLRHAIFFIVLALTGLLALTASEAQAQYFGRNKVQYEQFHFHRLETDHFVFHFYPSEEQAVRDAARMAERWYERHSDIFLHRFDEKKPIILYANDADFQQTNVVQQAISQGTGGLTEPLRERVVMPLSPSYGETNHVLGHELVHSFQFDLALHGDSLNINPQRLPQWLIEGMAEYLSVGRHDSHTALWMRDAVRREAMPTFDELANPQKYFPYRYGHAYLAYIGGKYGDGTVADLYKRGGQVGLDSAYVELFGITTDSLTKEWTQATREAYLPRLEDRTPPDSAGQKVLSSETVGGEINIAPALSPDGQYVAFISERELFNFNLYVADAQSGEVLAELDRAGTTGHFNALRFMNSAGTWSPDGRRLAFVTFEDGDNQLTIWNVVEEEIERSVAVEGVTSMQHPAWSPDGTKLAFSGTNGGISDLYVLNLKTDEVRRLTNDRYADLQPTWSPDGEVLGFTTDRAETNFSVLHTASNMDLGLIDVESGDITVREPFDDALHHNPQFSPDGQSLYFVSDQDGFKDIYRMELNSGELFRVTHLQTGVTGITALAPAFSIAGQSGDLMFSVYHDNQYSSFRRLSEEAQGKPLERPSRTDAPGVAVRDVPSAGTLPPALQEVGLVTASLRDPESGLPPISRSYEIEEYDPSLSLEAISPAGAGASVGGPYGSRLSGGIAFQFGDMLGHESLTTTVQAIGTIRDVGGSVSYLNRRRQLNWGGTLSHTPLVFGANSFRLGPGAVSIVRRAFISSARADARYPLDPTRRFEFSLGGTRYGFGVTMRQIGIPEDLSSVEDLNQYMIDTIPQVNQPVFQEERDTKYLGTVGAAYVRDFSSSGLTGPLRGGRWRLEVAPTVGVQNFVTARIDLRRYVHAAPVTFALQALHVGNYGAEFTGEFGIGNEYIGYPQGLGFVRGYNVQSIAAGIRENEGCTPVEGDQTATQCAEIDRLFGTRAITTRGEIRVPLLGPERLSLIPFRYVPTTLALFTDVGLTWSESQSPAPFTFEMTSAKTNIPVVSTGLAARFNVLGSLLLETYLARPFQRRDTTWEFGLRLTPGF